MNLKRHLFTGLAATAIAATSAFAAGHSTGNKAVDARQAHMQLYAFHLGTLGAMAKGDMEYNAEMATAVAGDFNKLATMMQIAYWPPGTTNEDVEGSRALAAAWENIDQTMAQAGALAEATAAMAEAAGTLDGLRGAMGGIGKACGDCHKATRAPN